MGESEARRLCAGALGLLATAWIAATVWRDAHAADPRLPPEALTPGLADAIPGVGPASRDAVAEAIRARAWERIRPALRAQVAQLILPGTVAAAAPEQRQEPGAR